MFAKDGYSATATREIEKHAGTKRSLISYHFKNKEEFWKNCMEALFSRFKTKMQERSQKKRYVGSKSRLTLFISQFLLANAHTPEVAKVLADEFRRESWRQRWLIENYYRDFFWLITLVYEQECRRSQISNISLTQFYYLILGTMSIHSQAITHKILTGDDPSEDTQIYTFSSILTDMITTSVDHVVSS